MRNGMRGFFAMRVKWHDGPSSLRIHLMSDYHFPPGPTFHIPGANYLAIYRDLLGFLTKAADEFGDITHVQFGHTHTVLLNNPDYIQDVLVTHAKDFTVNEILRRAQLFLGHTLFSTTGDFHMRERRLLQPYFLKHHVAAYTDVMANSVRKTRDAWQDGAQIDVLHEMMKVALSIAGMAMVGEDLGELSDDFSESALDAMRFVGLMTTLPFGGLLEKLPIPAAHRFHKEHARLTGVVQEIIVHRRRSGVERDDILGKMLRAQKDHGDWLTDIQVRDELLTMLLAGHETTATGLSWTWHLLAQHPEVEARLHAELDQVLGTRIPSADDIPKLTYTEMVFAESMRLYPPAWIISRPVLRDYELAGYRFPTGTVFYICMHILHRRPELWPDPERFDPERMTHEARAKRHHYSYIPFGGGPHQCLGEAFAWLEGILVLATFAQMWRLRPTPGYKAELEPLITLRPKGGMPMTLEKRR